MNSFYGGLNGQSFAIKKIFSSRHQMEMDLNNGWTSSISVGEFVVVSYGMPNDPNYDIYKSEDLRYYNNKSYNSTLWQKIYDETDGRAANGLSYKLVASMTGNTPRITLTDPTVVLDADQDPQVDWNNTDLDNLILTFKLPRSQNLLLDYPCGILDCDESPEVVMDDSNINYPVLYFALPQSQVIERATVSWLKVGEKPQVHLNISDINRPILEFSLPVAQSLQEGQTTILDADEEPYFDIDFSDIDNPILNFFLPQSQVMVDPNTTVEGPTVDPKVSLDSSDVNHPKLEFTLPRAVRFYYGDLLGERDDSSYTLTNVEFADYAVGDFYINARTGFIYQVSKKDGNTCEFTYVACIQSPLPDVVATGINAFAKDENGKFQPVQPVVVRSFTNNALTAWKLEFKLPQMPTPEIECDFVGSGEEGSASVEPSAEDKVKFSFKIPHGSRMYAGLEVEGEGSHDVLDSIVGNAVPGDLYLNTKTGAVYKLDRSGVWKFQNDGLKGPVGDALNVVREYRIEIADDFNAGLDYIKTNYVDNEGNPLPYSPDELFAVTFVDNANDRETSYWYFYTEEGKWGRVQLTGGVSNMILNTYTESPEESPVTNKTYSVDYINKLIGGNITTGDADKKAFSKDQIYALLAWGTMEDAKNDNWWPELGEDYDTLSAEEVIALMSWGSIAKLTI